MFLFGLVGMVTGMVTDHCIALVAFEMQARPLTRYLPVHDHSLDLRQFVVAAGHSVDRCTHLAVTSTSCHGYLMKMGGRIRTWKKRWFVFDRTKRCLSYHADKSESRPRGVVYFQSIEDVFVDHLHKVKSPTPQLTFCVKTSSRMYYLLASSPDAMRIWIDVIFSGAEGYQQFAWFFWLRFLMWLNDALAGDICVLCRFMRNGLITWAPVGRFLSGFLFVAER